MEPRNMKKSIGIGVGLVAIASVAVATFLGTKKNDQVASVSVQENTTQSTEEAKNAQQQIVPKTGTVANVRTRTEEDEDYGDDEEGGNTTTVPAPTTAPTPVVPATTKNGTATYKNGTYTASGTYMSPGGQDSLSITLTLSKDIITSVSMVPGAGDRTSARYQDKFMSGYQAVVVGKDISSLYLTKVSGASLTPKGFNDALAKIKAQAKA